MKKLKSTKIIASTLVLISAFALNSIKVSAEWKEDSNGWWNTEGNSWSVGWREINGKWYYFGQDGYMVHDTIINGYRIGSDGAWIQSTQYNSVQDEKGKTSNNSVSTEQNTVSNNTNSDAIQSEYTSGGVTVKLEKSVYELGTKKINFFITNKTSDIYVCKPDYAIDKFENNTWHALTEFTKSMDDTIVVTPNQTGEGTVSLTILKGFNNLTPGKYRIVRVINSTCFELEFELK